MAHTRPDEETGVANPMALEATRWSDVLDAAHAEPARRAQALETLCRTYWEPLYAYIRRQGYEVHDAQDFTQSFFAFMLERKVIEAADPELGRFRCFLLACLNNFLASQRDKANALKRGGGKTIVPLDAETAEKHYQEDSSENLGAVEHFDRRWALTLLERAYAGLSGEAVAAGKAAQFEALRPFLTTEGGEASYATVAAHWQVTVAAVRKEVHRWRHRLREIMRAEIAQTLRGPGDLDAEMRYVVKLLSR